MGTVSRPAPTDLTLSRQWQFPLLITAVMLLLVGVIRLVPAIPKAIPVDPVEVVRQRVHHSQYAAGYTDAQSALNAAGLAKSQKAELHRLSAMCIYSIERGLAKHLPENAARIVDQLKAASSAGATLNAGEKIWMAEALTWLGRSKPASEAYEEALQAGITGAAGIRKKLVALLDKAEPSPSEKIDTHLEAILHDPRASADDLYWALQRKLEPLIESGGAQAALELIASVEPRLAGSAYKHHLTFEKSRCLVGQGRSIEAERVLRELLNGPGPKDDLWARAALLFAGLQLNDGRPEAALSIYDEIQRLFPTGPRYAESLQGRGESLFVLDRFEESAKEFERLVELSVSDGEVLRARLTTLSEQVKAAGRPETALALMRLALRLIDETDEEHRGIYEMAIAELSLQLAPLEKNVDRQRSLYRDAGEAFVRLSKASLANDAESTTAQWRGMESFDAAGDTERTMTLLEQFVRQRLADSRRPEGLLRLGKLQQSMGSLRIAAETFEELVTQYPRTQEALHAVVRQASCLAQLDNASISKAEKLLLSMVEPSPDHAPLFDPRAPEYAEALFRLGELYATGERFEDAIYRLETLLELPGTDVVSPSRARFLLADCYRRSGRALAAESFNNVNAEQRDRIVREARSRVGKSVELYERIIETTPADLATLPPLERSQLRAAWLNKADCLFDIGRTDEARDTYAEAAWRFDGEYAGLVGLMGVAHCQRRSGQVQAARSTLARMRVLCRRMPEEAFATEPAGWSKDEWHSRIEQLVTVSGM